MDIQIKRLSLNNFKGIRSFTILFDHITDIYGRNEAGKSTLMDAFIWLLFNKDSSDRKTFEIKTLDENNVPYHGLDHEVSGDFLIDGVTEISLRKVFREKWVSKRGEKNKVFSGHETEYFWNDVPMKESEYQAKIAGLLDEKLFKLITNTGYFNTVLSWQDRRGVLLQIAGKIEEADVLQRITSADNKEQVALIAKALNQNKTIVEFKAEISAKKKRIKEELDLIPARIDEANRSLPEALNFKEIEILLNQALTELETTDGLLMNKSRAHKEHQEKISAKIREVQSLTMRLQEIEFNVRNAVNLRKLSRDQGILNKKNELHAKRQDIINLEKDYDRDLQRKDELSVMAETLRKDWHNVNNEKLEFKEGEFSCPACKRTYEASDIESKKKELTANFNIDKSRRLSVITERGKKVAEEIKVIEANLNIIGENGKRCREQIVALDNDLKILEDDNISRTLSEQADVKSSIENSADYRGAQTRIAELNEEINSPFKEEQSTELLVRKADLNKKIDEFKKQLATKEQRQKILSRIDELKEQESSLAQELASLQGVEYCIEQFDKATMDELENRINGRFRTVRFKMFKQQINGGMEPCCETLVKGVPYPDINTAAKAQCGVEIINVLSDHYNIYAPIWVDNRESVTLLPSTKSQLINLFVSPADEILRIGKQAEAMSLA